MHITEIRVCPDTEQVLEAIVSLIAGEAEGTGLTFGGNRRTRWQSASVVHESRSWAKEVIRECRESDCASQPDAVVFRLADFTRVNKEAGRKFAHELWRIRRVNNP